MRTFIDHTVIFLLEESEGDVVRTGDRIAYARLEAVTVHLKDNGKPPLISASGMRCRKDGGPDLRLGHVSVPVALPDPDLWIERAKTAVSPAPTEQQHGIIWPDSRATDRTPTNTATEEP